MTLNQFLLILWARRTVALAVLGLTVLTTLTVSLLLPKQYTAATSVVVDVKSPDPIVGMVLPGMMAPGYMATQIDIINSDRTAQLVVKLLRMDENPQIKEQWQEATDGKGQLTAWLAQLLQKKLDVQPARESNVIHIGFTGQDPVFAAAIANAFAEAYIATNIELRVEPARQYANWFDQQVKAQRERLEVAQKALSDFQQKTGIIAADKSLDYEMQKYNELSALLTQAESQGADSTSKQKIDRSDTLQEVMQNPLINQLKADLARLESRLKELSGNLGENHPQYQRMLAEINELRTRVRSETAKVTKAIGTAGLVSEAKEIEIQAAIEAQRKKVLDLKIQRDEIDVLAREVETAQRGFDAIGQRMTQSKFESQSLQTNIAILTPASQPLEPSKPKLLLNLLVSVFLGTLLGIGAALLLELAQRRVRSADDLAQMLDLPVLAALGSAHTPGLGKGRRFSLTSRVGRRNPGTQLKISEA